MLLGYQLLLHGSNASPITVKVCHSYSWRSLQCEIHIAQEITLLPFFCPPLRSLTCPFERNDLPYGPAPGALWEDSALAKVPSETSGGQQCAVDEGRRRWPSSFSTWTLKQLCEWFSWKQTCLLPLLHSQEHPDLGMMLGNQPCLLTISLSLPSVSSNVLVAVQALSHLPKKPVGFGDEGGDWEYHYYSSFISYIYKKKKYLRYHYPPMPPLRWAQNVLEVVAMFIITIPF